MMMNILNINASFFNYLLLFLFLAGLVLAGIYLRKKKLLPLLYYFILTLFIVFYSLYADLHGNSTTVFSFPLDTLGIRIFKSFLYQTIWVLLAVALFIFSILNLISGESLFSIKIVSTIVLVFYVITLLILLFIPLGKIGG